MRDVSNEGDREAIQGEAMARNQIEEKDFSQTAATVRYWFFTKWQIFSRNALHNGDRHLQNLAPQYVTAKLELWPTFTSYNEHRLHLHFSVAIICFRDKERDGWMGGRTDRHCDL